MEPILAKYIVEFRYPPAVIFHDRRGTICQKMQGGNFEHWRLDSLIVNLYNEDKTMLAFATSKNAGMHFEFPGHDYQDYILNYFRIISKQLELTKLFRIGVRLHLLYPIESMDIGKEIFDKKVFGNFTDSLSKIGSVSDYGVTFNYEIGDNKGRLTFGPMGPKQLFTIYIKGTVDREKINVPDNFIFVDFDLYRENIGFEKKGELEKFIIKFAKLSDEQIKSSTNEFVSSFLE